MKEICFSGCGGLYNYFLGIASIIQENFELDDVIFTGKSAGCFPALALSMNTDIDKMFDEWNIKFLQDINQYPFKALFNWNYIVRKHTLKYLPDDLSNINSKLHCHITELPHIYKPLSWKTSIINSWDSKEDLMNCLTASSFIPIFDNKFFFNFRDKRCMDGFMTHQDLSVLNNNNVLEFRPNKWRSMRKIWFWCHTDPEWAETLYQWGKDDATLHLDELNSFFSL